MNKILHKRALLKTITWRFIASATTFALVYIGTGELSLSLSVGGAEVILKMLFYYLHERAWNGFAVEKSKPSETI